MIGLVTVARGQQPNVRPLRVQSSDGRRVTFAIDVELRGGFVHVAQLPIQMQISTPQGPMTLQTTRLLVLDGVHRLLALLEAGRKTAYAILLDDLQPQHLAMYFGQPLAPWIILDAVGAVRPPVLDDYLDAAVYDVLTTQSLDLTQRLVVQRDLVQLPHDKADSQRPEERQFGVSGLLQRTLPGTPRARARP